MKAIGCYRWIFAYPGLTTTSPYFGIRTAVLPMAPADSRVMTQILVRSIWGLAWINIDPDDLTPN